MRLAIATLAGLLTVLAPEPASADLPSGDGTARRGVVAGSGLVDPQDMPGTLKEVAFDQHLGETLPLDVPLVDDHGREVVLGDYFGDKPVILAFVYYDCPMLCTMVMHGIAKSVGVLSFDAGKEFDVVAISIDPSETPEMAAAMKSDTVNRYGRPATADGWHFLTGPEESIRRLTEAAGFSYAFVPENGEFAHASGMIVATPEGTLAQYFYGIDYQPRHVRLALVEASANQIGGLVDQLLLYCFRYDPKLGKYTAVVTRILRITGAVFVLGLSLFIFLMWRREQAAARRTASTLGAVSR